MLLGALRSDEAILPSFMDLRADIEALVDVGRRAPGSDAERRAAAYLKQRLEGLGRQVEVESVDVWPAWPLAYAILAGLAVLGSVLSVSVPALGAGLALIAALLTFLDAGVLLPIVRRLLGRRASQNVVSWGDRDKPGLLLLVAHYDAGRGGIALGQKAEARRAAFGNLVRRPIGPLEPLFWAELAVLVLRLAERFGGGRLDHFDVHVLLTGGQKAIAAGSRAFLKRHKHELGRERAVVLNLDAVGSGTVRYTSREGPLVAVKSHPQLVQLCQAIAEDDEDENAFGARPIVNRSPSDGYAARSAGLPAITISCRGRLDYVPARVDAEAIERAEGFCAELIRRLDAEVGPDLRAQAQATVLTEAED